jgi:guanylate kinase
MSARPLLVVLSGPSGVGKDETVKALRKRDFPVTVAITASTRPPRPGEQQDVDYLFVSEEEFQRMLHEGELLEWATVYGNHYGVPRGPIREALAKGQTVIVKTDVQGAATIRGLEPEALLLFLAPPTFEALERRLRNRGGLDEASIRRRLADAAKEMQRTDEFDYIVINYDDALHAAVDRIQEILTEEAALRGSKTGQRAQ